ncbi:unnamed protein product [Arctia plantaginis]|uniref:Uncharacterized protein n=1 Tax=Arctia plantaginis TaxID=874455 RepID=A0A8S1BP32_ARCPL|nr:unnamed protein product [Arctia plantaginis]
MSCDYHHTDPERAYLDIPAASHRRSLQAFDKEAIQSPRLYITMSQRSSYGIPLTWCGRGLTTNFALTRNANLLSK